MPWRCGARVHSNGGQSRLFAARAAHLALLIDEFRTPSRLTDSVLRFARSNGQDPHAVLDLAFDALATVVAGILDPKSNVVAMRRS